MRKTVIAVAVASMLSGCALFENRLSCFMSGDGALFTSMYMNIGISSPIAEQDTPRDCKALKQK